jgi:hypothetical protein
MLQGVIGFILLVVMREEKYVVNVFVEYLLLMR